MGSIQLLEVAGSGFIFKMDWREIWLDARVTVISLELAASQLL
jgi:hypothetical protein